MSAASTQRSDFIPYPTNRVVGTVADAGKAREAIEALLNAGFQQEDIDILHGEEDLKRLGETGAERGFLAQFHRTLIRVLGPNEEYKHLTHHLDDVRAGRYVIMARAKHRAQRIVAADILNRYGAEFVGFYGRWAWEHLPAAPHTRPDEIPGLFAQAWNNRDASALAALFDEDAEFVNGMGTCWQNRESIRKGHADGLERLFKDSTLAVDEVKVKLLSPDVAVARARMTRSGQAAGAIGAAASGTMLVSFVVHRIVGDRWLCTSAHCTDVVAAALPPVIDDAGMLRQASPPSRPPS